MEECVRTTATTVLRPIRQGNVVGPAVGNVAEHQALAAEVKIFQAVCSAVKCRY